MNDSLLIDDFSLPDGATALGTSWRAVTDRVMGGVSRVTATFEEIDERRCIRMRGDVRLENNGGFVQVGLDLAEPGSTLDAGRFDGVYLWVYGNDQEYSVHLRTPDVRRPWQSYRATFRATTEWNEIRIPFTDFEGYRIDVPFDSGALRRVSLLGIGRVFTADLAVAELGFYSEGGPSRAGRPGE